MHGIICLWYGALVDIPDGWVVCDGNNGTPDLINRFVRGAAGWVPPGTRRGDWGHSHSGNTADAVHSHSGIADSTNIQIPSGSQIGSHPDYLTHSDQGSGHEHTLTIENDTHAHAYETSKTDHIPPCTHLYWIMKT